MPNLNVTNLLTLPHLKLTHIKADKRFQYVFCESDVSRSPCPYCGDEFPRVHQRPTRTLKDSVIRGRIYILKVKIRRYRCRNCHKTFNEELSGIKKYQRLTEHMKRNIYWACESFADLKKVRKYTRCGTKTIFKSYYTRLEEKQRERQWTEWPRTIGIDEHGFIRNKAKMMSILTHILGRKNVKNVTMDLYGTYRSFVKDFFSNAQSKRVHQQF